MSDIKRKDGKFYFNRLVLYTYNNIPHGLKGMELYGMRIYYEDVDDDDDDDVTTRHGTHSSTIKVNTHTLQ